MNIFYQVDSQGYPLYDTAKASDDTPAGYVLGWTEPFYKPRWDGEKWVEGATPEEIEEINKSTEELSEVDKLKEQVEIQQAIINDLLFTIIPEIGGL